MHLINTSTKDGYVFYEVNETEFGVEVQKEDCTVRVCIVQTREAALLAQLRQVYLDEMGSNENETFHEMFDLMVRLANNPPIRAKGRAVPSATPV